MTEAVIQLNSLRWPLRSLDVLLHADLQTDCFDLQLALASCPPNDGQLRDLLFDCDYRLPTANDAKFRLKRNITCTLPSFLPSSESWSFWRTSGLLRTKSTCASKLVWVKVKKREAFFLIQMFRANFWAKCRKNCQINHFRSDENCLCRTLLSFEKFWCNDPLTEFPAIDRTYMQGSNLQWTKIDVHFLFYGTHNMYR